MWPGTSVWLPVRPHVHLLVAAVSHREYLNLPTQDIAAKLKAGGVFVDVKASFNAVALQAAGFRTWRL